MKGTVNERGDRVSVPPSLAAKSFVPDADKPCVGDAVKTALIPQTVETLHV